MNLFEILANAQGGNGIETLSRQFNLSPQQTQEAIDALLPAFSQGLKQNAAAPAGLDSFLSALSSGQHARYFDDASAAFSQQGMSEGNGILGHLFGSKDVSRAVTEQAAQATGIGQQVLKQMLPAIATMLMGGMFTQTNNQMAAGGFGGSNNPLGELIEQMMRQGGGAQQRQAPQPSAPEPRQPQSADNPLGNNPLGEILGQILRGGQSQGGQPSPRSAPQGNNPFGDILDQILRGQQPGSDTQPSPQPQRAPRSGNPLEEIFGKMVEPGKQMGNDYQKGIDNIFEQYRRGLDRFR